MHQRKHMVGNTDSVYLPSMWKGMAIKRVAAMYAFMCFTAICLALYTLAGLSVAHAEQNTPAASMETKPFAKQELSIIKNRIVEYLTQQTVGYPGKIKVSAGAIDPNLRLPACSSIQVFLPAGSRAWGKSSVGVRCEVPANWTIYVQTTVSVSAQYLIASLPLAQGHIITSDDLMFETGELTQLPAGVFTDIAQAVGRSVSISMGVGTILRQEMLKVAPVVQQGQTVMLTSIGNGFSVSAEGRALANANEGQIVQVKVASGQVVTGIARIGGQIQVGY